MTEVYAKRYREHRHFPWHWLMTGLIVVAAVAFWFVVRSAR